MPSATLKAVYDRDSRKKNSSLVNVIKSGLNNLKVVIT